MTTRTSSAGDDATLHVETTLKRSVRLSQSDVAEAAAALLDAGADDTARAAWTRRYGAALISTLAATERERGKYAAAYGALEQGMMAGITFFRDVASVFTSLKPGRVKGALETAAAKAGPVIIGKTAAAMGAIAEDDPQRRTEYARKAIANVFKAPELAARITDDDLKVM